MPNLSSRFLFWCAVWIAVQAALEPIFGGDDGSAYLALAIGTLGASGVLWIIEHVEWKS